MKLIQRIDQYRTNAKSLAQQKEEDLQPSYENLKKKRDLIEEKLKTVSGKIQKIEGDLEDTLTSWERKEEFATRIKDRVLRSKALTDEQNRHLVRIIESRPYHRVIGHPFSSCLPNQTILRRAIAPEIAPDEFLKTKGQWMNVEPVYSEIYSLGIRADNLISFGDGNDSEPVQGKRHGEFLLGSRELGSLKNANSKISPSECIDARNALKETSLCYRALMESREMKEPCYIKFEEGSHPFALTVDNLERLYIEFSELSEVGEFFLHGQPYVGESKENFERVRSEYDGKISNYVHKFLNYFRRLYGTTPSHKLEDMRKHIENHAHRYVAAPWKY